MDKEQVMHTIAIVGMGSRGLSVLEQLLGLARDWSGQRLRIEVFDPQEPGGGLHWAEQPDYLMLNTMAGQLTAFSTAFPASAVPMPGFLQWCHAQGVLLDERGHLSADGCGQPVAYGDFVPRKLLGRYLQASYRLLLELCPAHIDIRHHAERIVACRPRGEAYILHSEKGDCYEADGLFLTTGHNPRGQDALMMAGGPATDQRVAIEGLGLTAMDTLAALTQGRGGRYVRDGQRWRYQASGNEPQLFLFSRSGLPFHARPQWQEGKNPGFPRLYFTAAAIDTLRQRRADRRLDFRRDLLPLIKDEMRARFYQAKARQFGGQHLAQLQVRLCGAMEKPVRDALFAQLAETYGDFDPGEWMGTEPWRGDARDYGDWFRQWIESDLALSRLGTRQSPLKQALEVWRDYRDLLRLAVDHDGLDEASTLDFYGNWAGVSNRLVGGPQKERYEDLLALIDAGVVQVLPPMRMIERATGYELRPMAEHCAMTVEVDSLIRARNAHSGLSCQRHPLLDDLLRQGQLRSAHDYPADGIDIDRHNRARRSDGSVHERLWVLGPAVEGCLFYNHYVPTLDPTCRAPLQARAAVQSCLDALGVARMLPALAG